MQPLTIIDDGRPAVVDALVDGAGVRLPPASLEAALGWTLRPEGVCRDDRCVLLPDGAADGRGVDLAQVAAVLRRPLALDLDERVACLSPPEDDGAVVAVGAGAPDFTLPDLDGRPHSLADYRGRKVMLIAWASW